MNGISKEKDLKISKCNLAYVYLEPMHPVVSIICGHKACLAMC